jgi:predicted aspartyl protease
MRFGVLLAATVFAWRLLAGSADAECVEAPDLANLRDAAFADYAAGPAAADRIGRVVAPVSVNGQGPFRFIVDTGANRSVVSEALAAQLGLTPHGIGEVHSVHGVSLAPLVDVSSLHYGDISLNTASLPMLSGAMLAGEQGLLGVDGMRGRRLRIDFDRTCVEIVTSRGARRLGFGWTTVRGELRSGHLVLVRGEVSGLPVNMFIDTGSNTTLANLALRDRLRERIGARAIDVNPVRAYTAGRPVVLDALIMLPLVSLGDIEARNIAAYVDDYHIFRLWGLGDEPALLIGMDVLSQTRGVAIDYERATVHLHLRDVVTTGSRLAGPRGAGAVIRN